MSPHPPQDSLDDPSLYQDQRQDGEQYQRRDEDKHQDQDEEQDEEEDQDLDEDDSDPDTVKCTRSGRVYKAHCTPIKSILKKTDPL